MSDFRFEYDEDNLKDIKIICDKENDDLVDTIKVFCIDSIPPEYQPTVEETDYGYLVSSEENGEEVLTHIFKNIYLVTRLVMIFRDEFEDEEKPVDFDNIDFSLLRPDIEKVEEMGYKEISQLINEIK